MTSMGFSLAAYLREFSEWLQDPTTKALMHDEARAGIEAELLHLSQEALIPIANHLDRMKMWEGVEGAVSVLKGKKEGWSRLQASLHCAYWSARIFAFTFDKDTRRRKRNRIGVNPVGLALAHALSAGDNEVSTWLGQRMLKSLKDGAFGSWDHNLFEPFILKLYGYGQGRDESGFDNAKLGVYQEVLKHWDGSPHLSRALEAMCDYHIARTDDPKDEGFPEFIYHPYNVFPVDALAVINVRKRLGLETPTPRHALLESPLTEIPSICPKVTDAFLIRVFETLATRGAELGL